MLKEEDGLDVSNALGEALRDVHLFDDARIDLMHLHHVQLAIHHHSASRSLNRTVRQ